MNQLTLAMVEMFFVGPRPVRRHVSDLHDPGELSHAQRGRRRHLPAAVLITILTPLPIFQTEHRTYNTTARCHCGFKYYVDTPSFLLYIN